MRQPQVVGCRGVFWIDFESGLKILGWVREIVQVKVISRYEKADGHQVGIGHFRLAQLAQRLFIAALLGIVQRRGH